MKTNNYKNMDILSRSKVENVAYMIDTSSLKSLWIVVMTLLLWAMSTKVSAQCESINLTCNDQINISINEDCYASINVDLLLENPPLETYPDDGNNYVITIYDEYNIPIVPSNQVNQDFVGQTLKAKINLVPCGISCWGTILVEDKIGPKIWGCVNGALPDLQIDCNQFSDGFDITPPQLGTICPEVDVLTFEDDTTALNCTEEFAFNILRTWKAEDNYGNMTSCNQTVMIRKIDLKDIVIPDDYVVQIDQNKDCSVYLDISPEKTGLPTGIHCPNIMYEYSDIDYPQCGIQRKLLREWFVIDWCTGESFSRGQIIKYIDESTPRVETRIDTLLVDNDKYACGAIPILNPLRVPGFDTLGAVTVLDTCMDAISVQVGFLQAVPGQPQPLNVPYYIIDQSENGTYELPEVEDVAWVRYCFTDECGNSTRIPTLEEDAGEEGFCHYFKIKSNDVSPPTALCEGFTKVPLGENGLTEVFATTFDNSSYDPCGVIDRFEVKRENRSCSGFDEHELDEFGDSIHFCCEDLGDTITVRLRVFDMAGNFSECLGLVCVSDVRTPNVVCPDSRVDLDCGDDYTDHDLIGLPTGEDGCDARIKFENEEFNLGSFNIECGVGTIVRTIDVTDASGNFLTQCAQTIKYDPSVVSTPLQDGDYDFPDDVTIDVCSSAGSLDPIYTGIPTTSKSFGCANINITYEDDAPFVNNVDGLCYTILRRWRVIDWCNFNPAYPDLYAITATQEIAITDSSTPIFNCPGDLTFNAEDGQCEADVDLFINVSSTCNTSFDITWEVDLNSDGTIDFDGTGNDASDVYPVGEHTITFTGGNQCGGVIKTCTFGFEIKSDAPPLAICLGNVIWSLGNTTETEVWASDFDAKSEGGCGLDELIFSFVDTDATNFPVLSQNYSCADMPNGIYIDIPVTIYIVDEAGQSTSCNSILQLQDTQNVCLDTGSSTVVSGGVRTEENEPLEEVMMSLQNMNDESMIMQMTGLNGGYSFDGVNDTYSYNLKAEHDADHLNGISTLDLVMLQRHILGLNRIDSPYKLIAGDVDNSGSISAIDLIQLRKLILGMYDELPDNDSWVFVPKSHQFTDVNLPWDYPGYVELNEMKTDVETDFVAVKIGDVNNSVELGLSSDVLKRSSSTVYLQTPDEIYKPGELVAVPLIVDKSQSILGMQFSFDFDDSKLLFEGIDDGIISINQDDFSLVNDKDGMLTFSIANANGMDVKAGETLFTIYFESRENIDLTSDIAVNSAVTKAEIYGLDNSISNLELVVVNSDLSDDEIQVFQNEPNPFNESTQIAFSIPRRQNVSLTIFDSTGKVLLSQNGVFEKGVNQFVVEGDELDAQGLLFFRVESQSTSITKKMIKVK